MNVINEFEKSKFMTSKNSNSNNLFKDDSQCLPIRPSQGLMIKVPDKKKERKKKLLGIVQSCCLFCVKGLWLVS